MPFFTYQSHSMPEKMGLLVLLWTSEILVSRFSSQNLSKLDCISTPCVGLSPPLVEEHPHHHRRIGSKISQHCLQAFSHDNRLLKGTKTIHPEEVPQIRNCCSPEFNPASTTRPKKKVASPGLPDPRPIEVIESMARKHRLLSFLGNSSNAFFSFKG